MSHPWKAQPYYLMQQPRTSGTVPAPMGAIVVRDPLGFGDSGYTRGSFAPKSPWAVPKYVASEPTGVDGFRGFGADQPGCVKPHDAAVQLQGPIKDALRSWPLDVPGVGKIGPKIADKITVSMLEAAVVELSSAVSGGTAAVKSWLKSFMRQTAISVLGSGPVGLADKFADVPFVGVNVWQEAADRLVTAVAGVPPNVCGAASLEERIAALREQGCDIPDPKTTNPTLLVQAITRCMNQLKATPAMPIYTITGTAVLPSKTQLVATGIKQASLRLAQPTVAPAKKLPTAVLVGAAALAAMLLLKK